MFLQLNHQKLHLYEFSKHLVILVYQVTKQLPPDERFGMISQMRRAALSVHLNIAEGASRRTVAERKRFYEIARGSLIEIDAALDAAKALGYLEKIYTTSIGDAMIKTFKTLTGLIKSCTNSPLTIDNSQQ
ncbi:four helix bundle protein [Aridibaculum aurantiacum]|uniref:four helix bundle protein n=1 Tax=Aridibaculum aurantiacum TaxID=2810307 RepID=UPI0021055CCC|nr:four helix bundle protein [Aridibaculum aurantiacum]